MAQDELSIINSKSKIYETFIIDIGYYLHFGKLQAQSGKKTLDIVRKEYKALNKNQGIKYLKYKHRMETAKELIGSSTSYSLCYTCNGYGVLYLVNDYGYPVLDYAGNYTFTTCEDCSGNGYVEE